MKYLLYISCAFLLAFAAVACDGEGALVPDIDPISDEVVRFVVADFDAEDGSRADINTSGQFSWTAGDTLGIFPEEGYQTAFPISEGTGTSSALFDGGKWALRKNASYAAYFPFLHPMDKIKKEAIPVSYLGQTQNGNNSTAHLGKYDYVAAPFTQVNESGGTTFQLCHLGALVKFKLTMPEAASYSKMTVRTADVLLTTEGTYNLNGSTFAIAAESSSYSVELDLQNIATTGASQDITLYMMMAPANLSSKTLTIYVTGASEMYKATVAGKNLLASKAYGFSATCEPEDNGNSHTYVDLGLPSGTLWATCNIGADNPEDYGNYFAWGETSPQSDNSYSWSSYSLCNGTYSSLTKYCTNAAYGTVDNKTVLETADDAAYANWGPAWKMPTQAQIQELYNSSNTTTTGYELNGVYGRKITSKKNGKWIFLPAAGYRYDGKIKESDSYGYYWTSTLHSNYSYYADYLYFYTNGIDWGYYNRSNGRSIRPVRK